MALSSAALEAAADAISDLGNFISLHTSDPGTTGAGEASYGGYTRPTTTWAPGSSDGVITGSAVTFNNVAAGAYNGMGAWSAVSAGTYIGGKTFPTLTLTGVANVTMTPRISVVDQA